MIELSKVKIWNTLNVIVIFLFIGFNTNAQIIFQENFNGADGTTSGTANGVNWSSSCPTCLNGDHWEIQSGAFEGQDTNGEAVWKTDNPIDISNCGNIEISFNVESLGTMEGCGTDCNSVDWVRFQYNIDGTGWVDPNNSYFCSGLCAGFNVIASDDVNSTVYSTGCIPAVGNSLQLRISVQCWSNSEYWRIDDVTVNCGSPDAGTNGNLDVCASSGISNLFNQLGGNPINGGTWSGPSNLTGGDLGTFNPATMNPGTYNYTVGNAPCQESASVTVLITDNNAGTNNSVELCPGAASIDLFDILGGNPDNNGSWTGPSNLTGGNLGTFDATTMNSGTYTYTVGMSPCEESASIDLEINGPTASFTASPTTTTTENTEVEFTNTSQNASNYLWDFGDNSANSFDINPIHIFPNSEPEVYIVTLIAYDDNNCSDTTNAFITVTDPIVNLEIPNIFTPNSDGDNDFFKLTLNENIKSLEVVILNRWGNVVFESNKVDFEWNGQVNNSGTDCSDGTYFYKINLTDLSGKTINEHGFVQIAR
ncbi:T9SS type B sorting domain-containing protein [Brumimicrobium glaciale]|uniref:T9SS type B sorting domain-containing protein n=1 Tax=Brumimicrobium glaciale TaxID=200475 RepID=A0A4Q4KRR4_9FLAO|nr:gliding motility-associated C-terminal domain-containing protein [Brumimicrobium glaciale]RYM36003.1 T9SS type B sorting domain-containing protein [Brumimicrobium glaciale]